MGTEQTGHTWRCLAMIVTPQDGAPTRDADPIMAAPAGAPSGNRQPDPSGREFGRSSRPSHGDALTHSMARSPCAAHRVWRAKLRLSGNGRKKHRKSQGHWNALRRVAFMDQAGSLRDFLLQLSSVERSSHDNGPRQKHQSVFGSEPGGVDRCPHVRFWQHQRPSCELGRDICARHHHGSDACTSLAPLSTTPLLRLLPSPSASLPSLVRPTRRNGILPR
jgi:hypothetical protein